MKKKTQLKNNKMQTHSGISNGDSMTYLFTSESVSEGHPDKLCDMISDSILDACISVDPRARVAVETMVKGTDDGSHIFIGGEVTICLLYTSPSPRD